MTLTKPHGRLHDITVEAVSMNMGLVTMTTMMVPNSVNENNLLPWQLINHSCKQGICSYKHRKIWN